MSKTYYQSINEMADDFVENYKDELNEIMKENKKKGADYIFNEAIYQNWDLNDKLHEWLDSAWYGFLRSDWCEECNTEFSSCAKLLDESNEVETDSGLWEGQDPKDAIMTQAFFTARTDLSFEIEKIIKKMIN